MRVRDFFYRYFSFTIAKVALLIGRSAILIFSHRWLSTADFALIAATLSFVEISRAFTDFGAENIIYTRLSSAVKPLSNIVKKLIRFRLIVSLLISSVAAVLCYCLVSPNTWPLFFLPLISAVQNSSVAFMQKNRAFKQILLLVIFVLCLSAISLMSLFWHQIGGIALVALMILPEFFSALVGAMITRKNWVEVLSGFNSSGRFLKRLSPYIMPSMLISILVVIYSRLDVMMVLPLLGVNAQADYSVGLRLVEPIFLLLSLGSLTLLAELGSYNTNHARLLVGRLILVLNFKVYVLLGASGVLLAFCLREFSIAFLNFNVTASWVAFLLVLAIPVKLCNTFLTTLLQRGGLYHVVVKAAIIVFLVTMIFGLLFGYYMGVLGIVLAALLAESFNFFYQKRMVLQMIRID